MEARNVREFNEMVEEVQQQFICYKEKADKKFQKIEDLLALAAHKMEILTKLKMLKKKRNQNPFAKTLAIENRKEDSLHHLRLKLPKFEGAEVSKGLHDHEHQVDDFGIGYKTGEWPNLAEEANENAAYTGEPIYDEEQGEGQEFCWPEQKFILEALNGSNSNSSELLKSEIFTTERPEANEDLSYTQAIQDRNTHSPLQKMKPIQLREIFSIIPARRETFEAFLSRRIVKDFLTAEIPHNLSMASSKFGKGNMLIFDPGGQVKNEQSKGVDNKFKDMIMSEVKLEVAVMKTSVGSQHRYWQDISLNFLAVEQLLKKPYQLHKKVFIIMMGNPGRLQSQGQKVQKENDKFNKIASEIPQHGCKHVRQYPSTKVAKANKGQVHDLNPHMEYLHSEEIVDEACKKARKCMNPVEVVKGKDQQWETQNCTSEGSKELGELSYIHYIQQGRANDNATYASHLSKKLNNFGKKNVMIIFDPGGYESADAFKMVKEMLGLDEKLVEVAIIIPTCDRLEQLQDQDIQKVCERTDRFDKIISEVNQQYVDSMRTLMTVLPFQYKSMVLEQGRPEIDNSTRSEYHEGSRKSVIIFIFDPGGDLVVFMVFYSFLLEVHIFNNCYKMFSSKRTCTLQEKKEQGLSHYPGCMKSGPRR